MASASSRRRSRKRDFHPPRTTAWVLAFWILLLFLCFIFAQPPSIVAYHRQNLFNYLWELCRSFVSTAILLWKLAPWDSVHHLWDFPLRSWELAMMQLHSVSWSLVINRLGRAWDVLKVVAGLSIGQWPILPVFAPDLIGKVFWGSFKLQNQTARAWLIEKMVMLVIVVSWTICGDFCLKYIGFLLKESWFVTSTWWSTDGDFSQAHIWAWLKEKWLIRSRCWSRDGDFSLEHTWSALKERLNSASIWSWLNGSI